MDNLLEIGRLEEAVKLAEERLLTVNTGLLNIETNIDLLSTRAGQLSRNIQYLKKKNIIALASEYKKVKEEFDIANARLELMREERENFRTVYSHVELEMLVLKEQLVNLIENPGGTVISADFRRSNGR
jgi:chromosome segregation ATPase